MRYLLLAILAMVSMGAVAGSYSRGHTIAYYDQGSDYFYQGVVEVKAGHLLQGRSIENKNLYIYNTQTDQGKLLFQSRVDGKITDLIFEQAFMVVPSNGSGYMSIQKQCYTCIKNNNGIKQREPANRIIIVTLKTMDKGETLILYVAKKDGSELQELARFDPATVSWHIDVKHEVLRLIEQKQDTIVVQNKPLPNF
ncbi:hypothetical protein VST7929_01245 [Vibrio stylophorae]|uniref:Uncharacterized protein n=1 Tax=Vibrio stylophorae TaxID=659351 RepID=A0ABN8DQD1_9VIBR|nr:hypothetical protein [Vibrio stylophorae]CAH0533379.1 hypothetical protein VST7929_01245 [Vibrio stylophorae]